MNTTKQIEMENVNDAVHVTFFLVGLPSDYDSWLQAFEIVSDPAVNQDPATKYLRARLTSDADVVIEATIEPGADVDVILDTIDAFIEEADRRYAITNDASEAIRANVQSWWDRRVSRT